MKFKTIAEKEIMSRSLLTGEERSFILKIEMPERMVIDKGFLYRSRVNYGWLGEEIDPRLRPAAEQGVGLSSVEALQDAMARQYSLPRYAEDYTFSHCNFSCFVNFSGAIKSLLSLEDVLKITGKSEDTLYSWMKYQFFPMPVVYGSKGSKFKMEDVQLWCDDPPRWYANSRLAAMCDDCEHKKNEV